MRYIIYSFFLTIVIWSCNGNKMQSPTEEKGEAGSLYNLDNEVVEKQNADTLVFHWHSDFCENNGYYLFGSYTPQQLDNTYKLLATLYNGLDTQGTTALYPQNIAGISTDSLTRSYNSLSALLDTMRIVNTPFWQEFLVGEKKRLKTQYDLVKMRADAFTNPAVLLNNPYIGDDCECNRYARALNSANDEDLYKEWEIFSNKAKENNGYPEEYMRRFYEKYNSPDKKAYAYIDMIVYAWWNCVNHIAIDYPDQTMLEERFKELFIKVDTYNCEEP